MKLKLVILITLFVGYVHSQNKQLETFTEKVELQLNTTTIVTGEKLLYSIFCLDNNNQLGKFSKVVYVKLINNQGVELASNKHIIKNGTDIGYFFVPSAYQTGFYKIVAYTKWIVSNTDLSCYEKDLVIINPYQKNENDLFKLEKTTSNKNEDIASSQYKKRAQVDWTSSDSESLGNFSISVRKTNEITSEFKKSIKNIQTTNNSSVIIPEIKGEIISGKITSEEALLSIDQIELVLTDKKNTNYYYTTTTNDKGYFYFILPNGLTSTEVFIEPLTTNKKYSIVLDEVTKPNFKEIKRTDTIVLKANYEEEIKKIAIAAQVENAYFEDKKDISIPYTLNATINKEYLKTYDLLNITRFGSLKEFIVEVINLAYYTDKSDDFKIHFRDNDTSLDIKEEPLVIVDGTFIVNKNDVLNVDFRKIISISIYNKPYYLGNSLYGGIFIINTSDNNFTDTSNKEQKIRVSYEVPFPKYQLFSPKYTNEVNTKIPDYRTQLHWQNNITSLKNPITFFTSDVEGTYEISLFGYTKEGKLIEEKSYFTVK